jgi:GNAT superfamily N-acetyltransferase
MEWTRDGFTVTTDRARLDRDVIVRFLASSYWAERIPRATVDKSIENSLCFGLLQGDRQIGFARVVTDCATFAYLADVFVLAEHRGLGLGKWLIR